MMDVNAIFIDTNILIRATVATAPLHEKTREILNNLADSGAVFWISAQIIREYMVNMTRAQSYMQPVPVEHVLEQIRQFRAMFEIAEETTSVLDKMLELVASVPLRGKQIHDINIIATMQVYGISQLLTYNAADFKSFSPFIRLIVPEDRSL